MKLRLFIDGASRGNPGPAGLGVVIMDGRHRVVAEVGEYLGETTNNVAEYRALLRGLREAREHGATEIEVFADSDLLVRQIGGSYRVKSPHLATLHSEAIGLLRGFPKWRVAHVPRGQNAAADAVANSAIDAVSPSRSIDLSVLVAREGARWRAWIPALPGCEAVSGDAVRRPGAGRVRGPRAFWPGRVTQDPRSPKTTASASACRRNRDESTRGPGAVGGRRARRHRDRCEDDVGRAGDLHQSGPRVPDGQRLQGSRVDRVAVSGRGGSGAARRAGHGHRRAEVAGLRGAEGDVVTPSISLSDLAMLMIIVSDNTATDLLVGRVGTDAINRRLASWGLRRHGC